MLERCEYDSGPQAVLLSCFSTSDNQVVTDCFVDTHLAAKWLLAKLLKAKECLWAIEFMEETPMLTLWRQARGRDDVAKILGYQTGAFHYILYKLADHEKYQQFYLPKRDGTLRTIDAPTAKLKLLQRRLASSLYDVLEEIGRSGKGKPLCHGFARSQSIITNAKNHQAKRFVLNLDLEDFFPSIHFGRISGALQKDNRFKLNYEVAKVIAHIACRNKILPQGSPCSPVISNIVGNILDQRLVRLAKEHKCTYSRYADDLSFSTNKKEFPTALATQLASGEGWILSEKLVDTIQKTGFMVNHAKTRMQYKTSRQVATGLVVNQKPNVKCEYYRLARAKCESMFRTGEYFTMKPAAFAGGLPSDPDVKVPSSKLDHLLGTLSYIYHIRVTSRPKKKDKKEKEKEDYDKGIIGLYRRFLQFKLFVAPTKPLIITEGFTDPIYLRTAIERLPEYHGKLATKTDDDRFDFLVSFFDVTSKTANNVLRLGTGVSGLADVIRWYRLGPTRYSFRPMAKPIIILADNDKGFETIKGALKTLNIKGIELTSTKKFYRLLHNLYLVKTPEQPPGLSCIEDLFTKELLDTEVRGKKFDPNKNHEEDGKYGKAVFAREVVIPHKSMADFTGFRPLLDRLVAVLEDYKPPPP